MVIADVLESFQFKLIMAFIAGSIIGLERQFTKERMEERHPIEGPGVRSFGLISLLGGASIILERTYGVKYIVVISFLAVLLVVGAFLVYNMFVRNTLNFTTAIVAILAFILGVFAGVGEFYWAIVISVFITAILAVKHKVIALLQSLEYREITSALEIAILALLILPIVPPIMLLGIVNLQVFLIFLIFVLSVEFMGYLAVRHLGEKRGLIAFAWLGALVHSESTTMEITRLYNKLKPKISSELASTAILLVDTVLILRSILFLMVLALGAPDIIVLFTSSMMPSVIVGLSVSYFTFRRQPVIVFERKRLLASPLSYSSAIKFALVLFTLTVIIVKLQAFGGHIVLLATFIGGFVSVAGVELAIASMLMMNRIDLVNALLLLNVAICAGLSNKLFYVKVAGGDKWLFLRVLMFTIVLTVLIIVSYLVILIFFPFL